MMSGCFLMYAISSLANRPGLFGTVSLIPLYFYVVKPGGEPEIRQELRRSVGLQHISAAYSGDLLVLVL